MNNGAKAAVRFLAQIAAWGLLSFVIVSTLSPLGLRPETGHVTLERFGAFALVGAAFTFGYPKHWASVTLRLMAAAGILEALQTLEPDRHGRWLDLSVKTAGRLAGIMGGLIAVPAVAQIMRLSRVPQ